MAVLSIVTVQVKPGRMSELVTGLKELGQIEKRVGTNLRSMRLFEKRIAGPNSGQVAIVFEYDDLASWGATLDAELRDQAFQQLTGPTGDDPEELVDQSLYIEIPI